jgi:hypothetical protein
VVDTLDMTTLRSVTTTQSGRQRRGPENGATIVEFAIVFPVVLMVILAIAEFGIGFKDWLSISHAAREGVRIGAIAGNDTSADIAVLRAVEQAMSGENMGDLVDVTISNPDAPGETTSYAWSGSTACRWVPCPDPAESSYVTPIWDPVGRKVSTPTQRIEVSIAFRHDWATGLFTSGPTTWTKTVIMDIEPQVFG